MSAHRKAAGYNGSSTIGDLKGAMTGLGIAGIPIPKLPGNKVYNAQEYQKPKQQRCRVEQGVAVVCDYPYERRAEQAGAGATQDLGNFASLQKPPDIKPGTKVLPPWVAYDRKVLRFYAYFQEGVVESAVESSRIRKCVILFYLEDGTLHIIEPREDNSGIPQGDFLRRHRVPKGRTKNVYLDVEDLNVGVELQVYDRTFYIYACDGATRSFMEREGRSVPADSEPREDDYHKHLKERERMKVITSEFRAMNKLKIKEETYKWLALDKKVLRFYCSWDDRKKLYGDKMPYILHYFLVDDTVEVAEVHINNSGRDKYPIMLKRAPLPKYIYSVGGRPMSAGTRANTEKLYYHWKDLAVGKSIYVYGRQFKLFDCDEFTRVWYKDHLDMDMPPSLEPKFDSKPKIKEPEIPVDQLRIGREEDTRQNCLSLMPKPPKPNWLQFQNCSGQVMRFYAWMADDPDSGFCIRSESDRQRRFVVSYHLVDDTVAIFEPPVRNSGIVGGKFLERGVLRKPGSRTVKYMAKDFVEGARITAHSRVFELGEPDLFTLNYQEARADTFPAANYEQTIASLASALRVHGLVERFKSLLIEADPNGQGYIEKHHLVSVFRFLNLDFGPAHATTIVRHLDPHGAAAPCVDILIELGCDDEDTPYKTARGDSNPGMARKHHDVWRPSDKRQLDLDLQGTTGRNGDAESHHEGSDSTSQNEYHDPEYFYREPDAESQPIVQAGNGRRTVREDSLHAKNPRQGVW